jgi:hypothetical protein
LVVLRGTRIEEPAKLKAVLGSLRAQELLDKLAALDGVVDVPRLAAYAKAAAGEHEARSQAYS